MIRYYFHLASAQDVVPDHEGVEVPDSDSEKTITRILAEIRSEEPDLFEGCSNWSIVIVDERGRRVGKYQL